MRTMRFRVLFLGASALLGIVALSFLMPPRIHVTQAACDCIALDMTQAEVEAIIGGPPRDYGSERRNMVIDLYGNGVLMNPGRHEEWGGDEGFIQVGFDENSKVLWTRFVPAGQPWTFLDVMQHRLDHLVQRLAN